MGVIHRRFNGLQRAMVPFWNASTKTIAFGTTNGAALTEPETTLPTVAERFRAIRATTIVRFDGAGLGGVRNV